MARRGWQGVETSMKTQQVRVDRAFYLDGKPTKVGEEIEVPYLLAVELRACNKATFIEPKAPAAEVKAAKAPEPKAAEPQKGAK
jgi:hypothetical protein